MDEVRGPAVPAAAPDRHATLDLAVLAGTLVEAHREAGRLELRLFGRLDSEAVALLEAELPESADLVDLTRLDSVEPAGLRSLIDHQRREQEAGRQLLLRIAPDQVLELTRPEI